MFLYLSVSFYQFPVHSPAGSASIHNMLNKKSIYLSCLRWSFTSASTSSYVIMGHQYPHSSSDLVPQVVRDVWREDRIYLHAGSNEAAVQSQSSTLVVVSTCFNMFQQVSTSLNKFQQISTIHFETTVVFESTNSLPGSFGPGATRLNNIGIEEERQKRNDVQHFINIGIFER